MTDVWLAEENSNRITEVLGIFSSPGKASDACQDVANEYFGAERTPPLTWLGDDGHKSASYSHAGGSSYFFQVTRFTVDEKVEP